MHIFQEINKNMKIWDKFSTNTTICNQSLLLKSPVKCSVSINTSNLIQTTIDPDSTHSQNNFVDYSHNFCSRSISICIRHRMLRNNWPGIYMTAWRNVHNAMQRYNEDARRSRCVKHSQLFDACKHCICLAANNVIIRPNVGWALCDRF